MMPAGKYYVGDLCYVFSDEEWQEICSLIFPNKNSRMVEGCLTLKSGKQFVIYSTKYGDGTYEDQAGNEYSVDSGTIGCTLISNLDPEVVQRITKTELGQIHDFESSFGTTNDKGILIFGNILVDTACDDVNEDDPWDESEDYWDESEEE